MMNNDNETKVLNFNKRYYDDVLSRTKTTTVRMLPRLCDDPPVVGESIALSFDTWPLTYVRAIVVSTRVKRLCEIDDDDAHRDGFASRTHLVERLRETYASRSINDESLMLIIEFAIF